MSTHDFKTVLKHVETSNNSAEKNPPPPQISNGRSLISSRENFISEDVFWEKMEEQSHEALKWKDLPIGVIYKIVEVIEMDGKFGKSKIFTLKDKQEESSTK